MCAVLLASCLQYEKSRVYYCRPVQFEKSEVYFGCLVCAVREEWCVLQLSCLCSTSRVRCTSVFLCLQFEKS